MRLRYLVALSVAAVVGLSVAVLVNIPLLSGAWSISKLVGQAFTFWGLIFGGFAAIATFGVASAFLNRRHPRAGRWGRRVAGGTLLMFALGVFAWIVGWGIPPLTLEGMWMYPLFFSALIGAGALLRRPRRGFWDDPPSLEKVPHG